MSSGAEPLTRARTLAVVATLWLVMFSTASQFLIVAPILRTIGEALAIPEALRGTLVSGYAVAVAAFALVAGPISDRFGRRVVLQVGSVWMAVALLLHALAGSFASLFALRVLAGAASGILSGASVAYIGDVLPYQQRGRALGLVMSGMAFGQILGIPGGTVLAGWGGFQAPFVAFGGVMVVAAALCAVALVPTRAVDARPLSVGAALSHYKALLGAPGVGAIAIASATMMFSVSAFIVYQPTWLEEALHADATHIATLFLVGGLANATMGPVAGSLSDRLGRKGLVVWSSFGLAAMMAVTPLIPSLGWAYPLFFLTMCLVGARISPLNAWMTALVDGTRRGSLMSLTMATGQAGFALGSAGAGWTYLRAGFAGNAWIAAGAAVVTAALLLRYVPEPPRGMDTVAISPTAGSSAGARGA